MMRDEAISIEEVREAVKMLKTGKTAGYDNTTAKMYEKKRI